MFFIDISFSAQAYHQQEEGRRPPVVSHYLVAATSVINERGTTTGPPRNEAPTICPANVRAYPPCNAFVASSLNSNETDMLAESDA